MTVSISVSFSESRASENSNELVLTDDDGVEMFECEHCDYCSTNEQDFNNHVTTHQQHQQTTPAQNDAQTIKLENVSFKIFEFQIIVLVSKIIMFSHSRIILKQYIYSCFRF